MVQAEPNALTEFPPPSSLPVLMNFNTHRCLARVFAVALSAAWTTQAEDAKVTRHYADNDGVKIHYATAGDSGPLVVMIHGFPDYWYSWNEQILSLIHI